jgi:hypothetical protein
MGNLETRSGNFWLKCASLCAGDDLSFRIVLCDRVCLFFCKSGYAILVENIPTIIFSSVCPDAKGLAIAYMVYPLYSWFVGNNPMRSREIRSHSSRLRDRA